MSSTGNGEGREFEPSGERREPEPSRDTPRDKRSPADFILAMFADEVSDWIIQGGTQLMDFISSL
ncbi:hypothetical protein [Streptomyces sp. NPDC001820]|uniref:hypothetical protein n=1 Tax=Streptomyces sp. NPDC001820 TaxID=3364613 RepID=UPI0036A393E4